MTETDNLPAEPPKTIRINYQQVPISKLQAIIDNYIASTSVDSDPPCISELQCKLNITSDVWQSWLADPRSPMHDPTKKAKQYIESCYEKGAIKGKIGCIFLLKARFGYSEVQAPDGFQAGQLNVTFNLGRLARVSQVGERDCLVTAGEQPAMDGPATE